MNPGTLSRALVALAAAALALTTALSPAQADYIMPPIARAMTQTTAVIDATVEGFDADGRAVIKIHRHLLGAETPASLFDVSYTCFGGPLHLFGVKEGERYVFMLMGDKLLEEQSFFALDAATDEVLLKPFYAEYLGFAATRQEQRVKFDALRARFKNLKKDAPDASVEKPAQK